MVIKLVTQGWGKIDDTTHAPPPPQATPCLISALILGYFPPAISPPTYFQP